MAISPLGPGQALARPACAALTMLLAASPILARAQDQATAGSDARQQMRAELQALQTEEAAARAAEQDRARRIEALARQMQEQTGEDRILPVTADTAAPGEAQALVAEVIGRHGAIDGFVHAVNRSLRLTALEVSDIEAEAITLAASQIAVALLNAAVMAPT